MAVDPLAVNFANVLGKELGNVFVGRPVDRHAERITVNGLESGHQVGVRKPVVTEPVKVGKLLVGQLINLAVRTRCETDADEIVQVQRRRSDVGPLAAHEVAERHDIAVTGMCADQVGIVDVGIVDVFPGLHLRLHFLNDIAYLDQVVGYANAGDVVERLRQRLALIFVRGERFRDDVDRHSAEVFRRLRKPCHFRELLLFTQRRGPEFLTHPACGVGSKVAV